MKIFLLTVLLISNVQAQSLTQIWESTVRYNQDLKLQEEKVITKQFETIEKLSAFLPTLALKYTYSESSVKTLSDRAQLEANLNLYNGGADLNNFDLAQEKLAVEKKLENELQDRLKRDLALLYLKGALNSAKEKIYSENKVILKRRETELRRRFNIGQVRRPDLIQTELELARIDRLLIDVKVEKQAVIHDISLLSGVEKIIFDSLEVAIRELETFVIPNNLYGQAILSSNIKQLSFKKNIVQSEYLPSIDLFTSYAPSFASGVVSSDVIPAENDYQFGLKMTWTFFEGFSSYFKKVQIESEKRYAQEALKQYQNKQSLDLLKNQTELSELKIQLESIKKSLLLSKEAFALQESDYRRGLITELEVISSFQTVLNLELDQALLWHQFGVLKANQMLIGV